MMSTDGEAAPQEIRIGASIPLTGLGATAGTYGKWGYATPIDDINKDGGLYLSKYGKKFPDVCDGACQIHAGQGG